MEKALEESEPDCEPDLIHRIEKRGDQAGHHTMAIVDNAEIRKRRYVDEHEDNSSNKDSFSANKISAIQKIKRHSKAENRIYTMDIEKALQKKDNRVYTSFIQHTYAQKQLNVVNDFNLHKPRVKDLKQMYVIGLRNKKKETTSNALNDVKVRIEIEDAYRKQNRMLGKDVGWEEDARYFDANPPMTRIFEWVNKMNTIDSLIDKDPKFYIKGLGGCLDSRKVLIDKNYIVGRTDEKDPILPGKMNNNSNVRINNNKDTTISRQHFELIYDKITKKVKVKDLGSRRGTWLSVIDNVYEPF